MTLAERTIYTQEPSNLEERKRFQEFRNADVAQMLVYCAIIHILFFLGYTLMLLNDLSEEMLIKFCSGLWFAMSYCLVSFFGKRFKSKLMIMVCVMVVLDHLTLAISTELLVEHEGASQAEFMASMITDAATIHILFLSPSIYHTVFYFFTFSINIS